MPRQTRHSTEFSGVYFVELANENKSFFIRYKSNGKSVEERAGRSNDGWNAEKAWHLRTERMSEIGFNSTALQHSSDLNQAQLWTFSKIFEKYLCLRPELKGRENDIYRFKNYLEIDFADITPEELTFGDVERLRHNLQNKGLKPATVRHVLELLRRIANFAVKKHYCSGLGFKIEMPKVENQKTEYLAQDQLDKLLQVLEEEPDIQVSNLVRLALYTGMRRGELFELCWSDIDFYDKIITVRSGKKGQHPKIPLNEMAEKVLAEHVHVGSSSKFVFPGRSGKKRTECKRQLLRIRKKAGLPDDFRLLQGLRHVYASMLVSSGNVDLETLQSLLTQKSPLMTQRYANLLDHGEDLKKSEIASHNETDLGFTVSESKIEVAEVESFSDSTYHELNEEFSETVLSSEKTAIDESLEVVKDAIASDHMEKEIATDFIDYSPFESNEEVSEMVIAPDTTHNRIVMDYACSESKEEVSESVLVTQNSEMDESEVSFDVITKDHIEMEMPSNAMDLVSNEEVQEKVLNPENEESEIEFKSKETEETPEVVIADNYKENTENTDMDLIEEVQETVFDEDYTDNVKQEEISSTQPESKSPEFSYLVKQNYSAKKLANSPPSEVFYPNNIVEEKKVEELIQKKARPTLKDLKNDLKSLSKLIQTAPRKSKRPTPKRKQS